LKEVLITISGNIIESAYVAIPLLSRGLDDVGILKNKELANLLQTGLNEFCNEIEELKT